MPCDAVHASTGITTISCDQVQALRNREIRQLCDKDKGRLRCGPHLFEIRWHGPRAVAQSATASSQEVCAVAALLTRRRRELRQERVHRASGTDRTIALNCKVSFERCPSQRIQCLHLALHWIGLFADGLPGAPDYTTLRTEAGLRTGVPYELCFRWPTNVLERGRLSVVRMEDWGRHFADRFADLERRGERATAMLVLTTDHAMAVGLKVQRLPARTLYCIHFYEPNTTAAHAEACFDELASMESLEARNFTATACDYWPHNPAGEPFDTVDAMLFVEISLPTLQELRALDTTLPAGPRQLHGTLPPPTADALWYLLRYGCDDAVRQLAPAIRALPHGERVRRLTSHRSTQPFFDVMTVGMPSTIALFGDLIAGMPVEQRANLLRSASRDGTTAFGSAVQRGRTTVFQPFWKLIQQVLPSDYHYPLLAAAMPDGTSSLYFAFEQGRYGVPLALAEALSTFPPLRLASLLCARSAENETGLEAAVRRNDPVMIMGFHLALRHLPPAARSYLLKPAWRLAQQLCARDPDWQASRAVLQIQVEDFAPHLLSGTQAPPPPVARNAGRRWRFPR